MTIVSHAPLENKTQVTAARQNAIKSGMSQTSTNDLFLSGFHSEFKKARPIETSELERISASLKDDLGNTSLGYHSHEDWAAIASRAGRRLGEIARMSEESLQESWHKVLREFHGQSNWGFKTRATKPKVVRAPETTDGLGWYIWAVFQPMTITKVAILYFGAKVAADSDDTASKIYLGLAVLYMFFSLVYFGWRQHKKNTKAK